MPWFFLPSLSLYPADTRFTRNISYRPLRRRPTPQLPPGVSSSRDLHVETKVVIHFMYHFGGQWVNNKGMQYVGGARFKMPVGIDVDRLGYWNIYGFYEDILELEKFRLWLRLADVNGDEGLLEIKDDKEVMKMIEHNKKHPFTDVYGVEEGDDLVGVDELKLRLKEAIYAEDKSATPEIFDGAVQERECSEDGDDQLDEGDSGEGDVDQLDESICLYLGYGAASDASSGVGDVGASQAKDVAGDSAVASAATAIPRPKTRASVAASRRAFFAAFDDYVPQARTKAAPKEPVATKNR